MRLRAKIELEKHDPDEVVAAAKKWAAALDPARQGIRAPPPRSALGPPVAQPRRSRPARGRAAEPEPRARAQAVRVLCYWRDRVPDALALLQASRPPTHRRASASKRCAPARSSASGRPPMWR